MSLLYSVLTAIGMFKSIKTRSTNTACPPPAPAHPAPDAPTPTPTTRTQAQPLTRKRSGEQLNDTGAPRTRFGKPNRARGTPAEPSGDEMAPSNWSGRRQRPRRPFGPAAVASTRAARLALRAPDLSGHPRGAAIQ